ncbi:hypothetical protein I552_2891 [Mycobacterium xenopi 3993]|nr:hypothetical protein I552_2891 [Mycobacterium xenopi 3993]
MSGNFSGHLQLAARPSTASAALAIATGVNPKCAATCVPGRIHRTGSNQ